uniref:Uncharacterized protein n=1 Tax=Anguilla anguilla TaxID=7936 RepID=A0A0E9PS89_ANGAN
MQSHLQTEGGKKQIRKVSPFSIVSRLSQAIRETLKCVQPPHAVSWLSLFLIK